MDCQQDFHSEFLTSVERIASAEPSGSISSYAAASFLSFMQGSGCDSLSPAVIREWIASMLMNGMKASTCKRYFGSVHSLFSEWSDGRCPDPFLEAALVFDPGFECSPAVAESNLKLVCRILEKAERSADPLFPRLFLYLLYSPDLSLSDVINLRFSDAKRFCQQANDIIDSFPSSKGRRYVFPLGQGKIRQGAIVRSLTSELSRFLAGIGMTFPHGFSRDSVSSLWVVAAMRVGVRPSEIRHIVKGTPSAFPALSLIPAESIPEKKLEATLCRVADAINDNSPRWFVMRLRRCVSVADVRERVESSFSGDSDMVTFFYPVRTVVRIVHKKRIAEEEPYLPGILFFKTRRDKVRSLFAAIGDLAWCFRTANTPDSDYAAIPDSQMVGFQRCVGQFTPDIRITLEEVSPALDAGRKVRITGGMMAGFEGEISDIDDSDGTRLFTIRISGSQCLRWTARVEDVFIQPID